MAIRLRIMPGLKNCAGQKNGSKCFRKHVEPDWGFPGLSGSGQSSTLGGQLLFCFHLWSLGYLWTWSCVCFMCAGRRYRADFIGHFEFSAAATRRERLAQSSESLWRNHRVTLSQQWLAVGPASATPVQQRAIVAPTYLAKRPHLGRWSI